MSLYDKIHYESNKKYSTIGKCCALCGVNRDILIHHLDYKDLGAVDRIVFLCGSCHSKMHGMRISFDEALKIKSEFLHPSENKNPEGLTVLQFAHKCGRTTGRVYLWLKDGRIAGARIDNGHYIIPSDAKPPVKKTPGVKHKEIA